MNIVTICGYFRNKFAERIELELAKSSSTEAKKNEAENVKKETKVSELHHSKSTPVQADGSGTRRQISYSSSSSDDYSYSGALMRQLTRSSSNRRSAEDKENQIDEEISPEQREMAKKKLSRKNSSLLDKILLNNLSPEGRGEKTEMFYQEPSASYVGAYE